MKVFDTVPVKIPAKNVFNLSHDVKATYNFDNLYPFLCQPVYPGDTFNCRAEVFLRAMPLKCPVMHNVDMRLYFFFVPNRLIWNARKDRDWKTFITGGPDGMSTPELPFWTYGAANANGVSIVQGGLIDHMGFPTVPESQDITNLPQGYSVKISALPFRAYQLIYNEYFRNQNVQNEIDFSYDEGGVSASDYAKLFTMRKKCWEKDYFTSCLPFQQRGQAMRLPISGTITAQGNADVTVNAAVFAGSTAEHGLVSNTPGSNRVPIAASSTASPTAGTATTLKGSADLSTGTVTFSGLSIGTITEFRTCLRLQQWLEANARCGSRYIEQLFAHFGVKSSDARLQRPELLGGGKVPLLFTDVEQNSYGSGANSNVLGNLGGKGTMYGKTGGFKKYFEEHGIIMGICCIIPRTSYSQGINRAWILRDKTDWYFPEFANLSEQAVTNKEIYFNPADSVVLQHGPDDVFGYQGRFTELRYIPSSVHGDLRDSLQYWHLGRLFDSVPTLNASFVEAQTRSNIFALSGNSQNGYDPFICEMHLDIKAVRPMPKYAVPTL